MWCVDFEDSDDVVLDEVLCVEKFKVDVFCSFASALSCSNALACWSLCGCVGLACCKCWFQVGKF